MANNFKTKINEEIQKFFTEKLGENYKVEVNWGAPITTINITTETEQRKNIWRLSFNDETQDYSLTTFGYKIEDEKVYPDATSIDSGVIKFLIENSISISEKVLNPEQN